MVLRISNQPLYHKNKQKMEKRGVFFTIDAVLAASIIVIAIIAASSYYIKETKTETIDYLAHDTIRVLTNLKVSEIDNAYTAELIAEGNITRLNNTILEQIGEFWSEDEMVQASKFAGNITGALIPERLGVGIWVDNELIYSRNKPITKGLVSSKKLISGIAKEKPIDGYTARAILTGINSKRTNAYVYFGGYEGDGNLTKRLTLPSNLIDVKNASLELDVGADFNLYINDIPSGSYVKGSAGGGDMLADKWNISSAYFDNFQAGNNLIKIFFTETENNYVAGGHLKVVYTTANINDTTTPGSEKFYLPGIEGFINLYSSIYVPGYLGSMEIYLNFFSNFTTYLKIGNTTVYEGNPEGQETITLSNTTLASIFSSNNLDYNDLSLETLPLRMGIANATAAGGNADSVLVTDVSGSMEFCSASAGWSASGWQSSSSKGCYYWGGRWYWQSRSSTSDSGYIEFNRTDYSTDTYPDLCGCRWNPECEESPTKMEIYINSSKLFNDVLLDITGNKIGVVEYTNNLDLAYVSCNPSNRVTPFPNHIARTKDLSSNKNEIENFIDQTESYFGTCICCGVNEAVDMLDAQSSSSRNQSLVVMSDGEANVECTQQGTGDPKQDAIQAAQGACSQGITVYAIGFGADVDEATLQSMACGGGSYHGATNPAQLEEVYRDIAGEIATVSYVEQIATNATASSSLNYNSYIQINYTPLAEIEHGKVPITTETSRFNNNITQGTLTIPENISIIDAKVTSYSGSKWTDNLVVNANQIYLLSDYGENYVGLGDPYAVQIPVNYLNQGSNDITISTGISPTNSTGGSKDNKAIYTLLLGGASSFTGVLSYALGCNWYLEFEDGTSSTLKVPSTYTGTSNCNHTGADYAANDAYNVAAYELFSQLDIDGDGRLEVNLVSQNVDVDSVLVSKVPSLWGPAVVEIRVWE